MFNAIAPSTDVKRKVVVMKRLALFVPPVAFFWSSSCMTATVIHDARHPGPKNQVAWGNSLFLPLTIPADIAT
jgi:hypothetical protein